MQDVLWKNLQDKTRKKQVNSYVLSDAVREGDPRRLLQSIKIALLFLHTYGRVKYAYVVLLFLAKCHAILPSGMAFELIHNRFFNVSGKAGGNIPWTLEWSTLINC